MTAVSFAVKAVARVTGADNSPEVISALLLAGRCCAHIHACRKRKTANGVWTNCILSFLKFHITTTTKEHHRFKEPEHIDTRLQCLPAIYEHEHYLIFLCNFLTLLQWLSVLNCTSNYTSSCQFPTHSAWRNSSL